MVYNSIDWKYTHSDVFGKESYIVLAYYANDSKSKVVIGNFNDYNEAIEYSKHIRDYINIQGLSIFGGSEVLTVPEKPISVDSPYWTYQCLKEVI